jgi:IPT/TIG domain-containing protein
MAAPQSSVVTPVLVLLGAMSLLGCGGSSGGGSTGPPNPVPAIEAISPNSSQQGGPSFTLSVVGSNFISGSSVQWNGSSLPSTFVSNALLTADVPASTIAGPGPDAVTVVNPAPGGGVSAVLNFAVPCVIPSSAPASGQSRARLGAYYFDGWSGPLTNFHFQDLPLGPYQDRQPFSAWQDNSTCAVEQQLATAHNFGVDFFVFDWYFNVQVNDPGENLNSALQITHSLPDRHGMQYAILYVSSPPFLVGPADWTSALTEWVGYMTDSAYVRINGAPAFFIINVGEVRQAFGTSAAVSAALGQLRAAAQAQGLPGVYIVGGFGPPDGTMGQESLDDGFSIAQLDGYDAVAFYGYPFAPPAVNGVLPFSTLSGAGHWTWNQAGLHCALPFIPTAMSGWDPRPWNETEPTTGDLMWYSRTPQEVATFAQDGITWANSNPQLRPEPPPTPPLVLIEAWNEFGEGSHVVPTAGDGTSYGDALAAMLQMP